MSAFDQRPQRITNFTNDLNAVKSGIDRVRVISNASTCLYDSLFESIDQLKQQIKKPQDRLAIVLFTDGQDTKTGNPREPCSLHTYEDVIREAHSAHGTPINTIGLSAANCSNLNGNETAPNGPRTGAFWATGGETNLSSMFEEIMQGVKSQWVARARVFADKGPNQAVLNVKLRDTSISLTNMFQFNSPTDYDEPSPPVVVKITGLVYNKAQQNYLLAPAASPILRRLRGWFSR